MAGSQASQILTHDWFSQRDGWLSTVQYRVFVGFSRVGGVYTVKKVRDVPAGDGNVANLFYGVAKGEGGKGDG
jgi:hypothetical protein